MSNINRENEAIIESLTDQVAELKGKSIMLEASSKDEWKDKFVLLLRNLADKQGLQCRKIAELSDCSEMDIYELIGYDWFEG